MLPTSRRPLRPNGHGLPLPPTPSVVWVGGWVGGPWNVHFKYLVTLRIATIRLKSRMYVFFKTYSKKDDYLRFPASPMTSNIEY